MRHASRLQCWGWLAGCQCILNGRDSNIDLLLLSQCCGTLNCKSRFCFGDAKQPKVPPRWLSDNAFTWTAGGTYGNRSLLSLSSQTSDVTTSTVMTSLPGVLPYKGNAQTDGTLIAILLLGQCTDWLYCNGDPVRRCYWGNEQTGCTVMATLPGVWRNRDNARTGCIPMAALSGAWRYRGNAGTGCIPMAAMSGDVIGAMLGLVVMQWRPCQASGVIRAMSGLVVFQWRPCQASGVIGAMSGLVVFQWRSCQTSGVVKAMPGLTVLYLRSC